MSLFNYLLLNFQYIVTMADKWEDEVEGGAAAAPAPIVAELPEIKLFGKWSCDEVNVSDMSVQVRIKETTQI